MSSSILSNNNCGPVTGLLSNPTFLLHAQTSQKTISPPPLWRTFYAPPISQYQEPLPPSSPLLSPSSTISNTQLTSFSNFESRGSPIITIAQQQYQQQQQQQEQITLNLKTTPTIVNLPNQRMTLQKLPSSNAEQTTQGASAQKSIMSVSKLVRPMPKNQHPHQNQHQNQHQHLTLHPQPHLQTQQQQQQQQQHQHYINDIQTGPINLVTNSQTDAARSRPSSNSSVDIESDDIPTPTLQHQQQQHHHLQQQQQQQQNLANVVVSSASMPTVAAYPFNYSHLYANKPGYHNAIVDTHRLHAPYSTYAAMASAIAASSPNNNNNIYSINSTLGHHQSIALAPPPQPVSTASGTIVVPSKISPNILDQRQHQQQQQQQQQHHHHHYNHQQHSQDQKLRLNSSTDHMFSPPLPAAATPTALSNGTYLNCKSSPASDSADSSTENYFKVPNISSGKEGSLKHRILTRPALTTEKDERSSKTAVISTYNSTANFKKGSYIELDNGLLRRVEDMRTEDFIQSAERNIHLQMAESTVVRIEATKPNMVLITFSYGQNRSKADLEVSVDHPFFVYGQGWASCDPDKSHKAFGLKCQRLQVGDICISLTQRTAPPPVTIKTEVSSKEENVRYVKAELPPSNADAGISIAMPIKNEQQIVMPPPTLQHATNLTTNNNNSTVTAATIFSRPPAHFMPCHMLATALPPPHHQMPYPDLIELVAAYNKSAQLHHVNAVMPPPPSPDAINGFYQQTQQLFLQGKVTAADLRLQSTQPPQPPTPTQTTQNYCPPRNTLLPPLPPLPPPPQHLSPMLEQHNTQDQPFDASIAARKRRWSAPEGDCDGTDDHQRDHCQNSKLYKATMAPVTT